MPYELEKRIWTDADFDKMGWHDNLIYKIRLAEDLEMDIDYILQWNQPEVEGLPFTFWIAPATLVFKNVTDLRFEFDMHFSELGEIDFIERKSDSHWIINTQRGDLEFRADGFEQFIRQDPSFQFGQTIPHKERCGFSLDRTINQENPNLLREDVIEDRKRELEYYENVKKRQLKRLELETLIKARDNNEIGTKEYLLKKKEINELLFSYDYFLKGTRFERW